MDHIEAVRETVESIGPRVVKTITKHKAPSQSRDCWGMELAVIGEVGSESKPYRRESLDDSGATPYSTVASPCCKVADDLYFVDGCLVR
jgi:hypothetical protein